MQGLDGDEVEADTNVCNIVGQLVFGWDRDLATRIAADYVVASPQEVSQVFQLVLTGKVQQGQVCYWFHLLNNLIKANQNLQNPIPIPTHLLPKQNSSEKIDKKFYPRTFHPFLSLTQLRKSRQYKKRLQFINNPMLKKKAPEVIFADIKNIEQPYTVQSMCVNCQKNGITTILLTKIPFFREVMIASFSCEECGFHNNECNFAGKLSDFGVDILFRVLSKSDLNRELIKSQYTVIHFQEIDLEIPANGKAEINTIEGYLLRTYEELNFHQALRKIHEPQQFQKLQIFLTKIKQYIDGQKFPLTIKVRDPSGNSTIKNPFAPKIDKNMEIRSFERSMDELIMMGYSPENAKEEQFAVQTKKICTKLNFSKPFEESNFMTQEAAVFETLCHACKMPGETRMCQTSVPYFSDLIIMSFSCDYCGAHSTQTKNSGEIKENASVITLKVEGDLDLKRDLFKSETCSVDLPEIELELGFGTLGGVFTTVEGLLEKIRDHFEESNPFVDSDSEFSARIAVLLQDLTDMGSGKRPFTMILIDPLAHSFIANPFHPQPDTRVTIQMRPRTFEENEELGLNDINTQNYKQKKQ